MTTNDPLERYSEEQRQEMVARFIQELGDAFDPLIRAYAKAMNPMRDEAKEEQPKREPLLIDTNPTPEDLRDFRLRVELELAEMQLRKAGLISDEGRLKVVEYAELWHPSAPEADWRSWMNGSDSEFTMLVTRCCAKNPWTPPWLMGKAFIDDDGVFNRTRNGYVCPGCGSPIKR